MAHQDNKKSITKKDYILRMLTKITKKRLEYFVVSRIVHGLDDFDIEFITQQLVRREEGRALTDMYFPQFGIHLEVNEYHHSNQVKQDERRAQDIISATDHEIVTIDERDDLEGIAEQADEFVKDLLAKRDALIAEKKWVPWDFKNRYDPESYRGSDVISVEQNVLLRRQCDALRLFGYKGKNYQRGIWKLPDGDGSFVWFPRLYEQKFWNNSLSSNGMEIIEHAILDDFKASNRKAPGEHNENFNRIVFAKAKDVLGFTLYRYVGTFRHNPKKSKPGENYFDRVSAEHEINLPPVGSYETD